MNFFPRRKRERHWFVEAILDDGQRFLGADADYRTAHREADDFAARAMVATVTVFDKRTGVAQQRKPFPPEPELDDVDDRVERDDAGMPVRFYPRRPDPWA